MIVIKTRLHSGIYKSSGGGQVTTHYTWETSDPAVQAKAAQVLSEHRKEMESAYGNIGCGVSWIEVDGTPLDECEVVDLLVQNQYL